MVVNYQSKLLRRIRLIACLSPVLAVVSMSLALAAPLIEIDPHTDAESSHSHLDGQTGAAAGTAALGSSTGIQRIGVLLFEFQDSSGSKPTRQDVEDALVQGVQGREETLGRQWTVSDFYRELSYGAIPSIQVQVFDWARLPRSVIDSNNRCSYPTPDEVEGRIRQVIPDIRQFDRLLIIAYHDCLRTGQISGLSVSAESPHANVLTIGQGSSDYQIGAAFVPGLYFYVVEHELLHTIALDANMFSYHPDTLDCDAGVIFSGPSCILHEGRNPFDFLASRSLSMMYHTNAFFKHTLGWLQQDSLLSINGTGRRTYELHPLEMLPSATQTGKVAATITPPGLNAPLYYLEYRQPIGVDRVITNTPVRLDREGNQRDGRGNLGGLLIYRKHAESSPAGTMVTYPLLDMSPSYRPGYVSPEGKTLLPSVDHDQMALLGTFHDPEYNITIGPIHQATPDSIRFDVEIHVPASHGILRVSRYTGSAGSVFGIPFDGAGPIFYDAASNILYENPAEFLNVPAGTRNLVMGDLPDYAEMISSCHYNPNQQSGCTYPNVIPVTSCGVVAFIRMCTYPVGVSDGEITNIIVKYVPTSSQPTDSTPPVITRLSYAPLTPHSNDSVTLTAEATDEGGSGLAGIELYVDQDGDGDPEESAELVCSRSSGSCQHSTAYSGPNTYAYRAIARDGAGNITRRSDSFTVTGGVPQFAYTLSGATPMSLNVQQGQSVSTSVSVSKTGGLAGEVTLTANDLPNGVSANRPSCRPDPTCEATVTLTATSQAMPVTKTFTVTGNPNTITLTGLQVSVTAAPSSGGGELIIDNDDHTSDKRTIQTGRWRKPTIYSGVQKPYGTTDYLSDSTGVDSFTWQAPSLPAGRYQVFMWWRHDPYRTRNAQVTITHATGQHTLPINQTQNGTKWNSLGTYNFTPDRAAITLSEPTTPNNFLQYDYKRLGALAADAVKFVPDGTTPPPPPDPNPNPEPTFDFQIQPLGNLIMGQNATLTQSVNIARQSGTAQPLTLTASISPAGPTVSVTPTSCVPDCSSTLQIRTTAATTARDYVLTVRATTSGNISRQATATLSVTSFLPPPPPPPPVTTDGAIITFLGLVRADGTEFPMSSPGAYDVRPGVSVRLVVEAKPGSTGSLPGTTLAISAGTPDLQLISSAAFGPLPAALPFELTNANALRQAGSLFKMGKVTLHPLTKATAYLRSESRIQYYSVPYLRNTVLGMLTLRAQVRDRAGHVGPAQSIQVNIKP